MSRFDNPGSDIDAQPSLGPRHCARPLVVGDVRLAIRDTHSRDRAWKGRLRSAPAAEEFHGQLPPAVRWKADNYNNLMEQPTLFYAVTLTLALLGADGGLNLGLAWLYVALRVVHSLIQATINIIMRRFTVFITATLVLVALSIRAAVTVL
jgi:hypothetical protein